MLQHRSDPMPEKCLVCNDTGTPMVPKIKLSPKIKQMVEEGRAPAGVSIATKSYDQVYRDMESASANRAQEAADLLGVPVSEVPNIKMTDMKDNTREGDIAAVLQPPSRETQAAMKMPGMGFQSVATETPPPSGGGGFGGSAHGPSIAGGAQQQTMHIPASAIGHDGAKALGNLQADHWGRAAAMTAKGEKARYTPPSA